MADRPLIAVPARFSASTSALRYAADVNARALVAAVHAAGGEPLSVHPSAPGGVVDDAEVADRLAWADGVLLPGGGDVAGRWAGQGEHPALYDVDLEQDAFDLAVARVALGSGVPLLAVCRGTQVVNVALGGTLVQDMDEQGGPVGHHRDRVHHVRVDPATLTSAVVGEAVDVSCYHHQALDRLGDGLVVVARAEEGVVEAVELPGAAGWFLGVQWHPEDRWESDPRHLALFEALVRAAAEHRAATGGPAARRRPVSRPG